MLAAHPEVQARLVEELRTAGLVPKDGSSAAAAEASTETEQQQQLPPQAAIDAADLGRLPFLNAVIKETLRLCPPAPWGSTKWAADSDVELLGYRVPKVLAQRCAHCVLCNIWNKLQHICLFCNECRYLLPCWQCFHLFHFVYSL